MLEQKSTQEQQERKEQCLYYQQGGKEKNPENTIPTKHNTRKATHNAERTARNRETIPKNTRTKQPRRHTATHTEVYTCPTCGRKYATEKTVTDTEPKE